MQTEKLSRQLAVAAGLLYAAFYLWAIGDLDVVRRTDWSLQLTAMEMDRLVRMRSLFLFEAVGMLQFNRALLLISPGNLLIAAALAGLLVVNIHGAVRLRQQPASCGTGRGACSPVPCPPCSRVPPAAPRACCCCSAFLHWVSPAATSPISFLFPWGFCWQIAGGNAGSVRLRFSVGKPQIGEV